MAIDICHHSGSVSMGIFNFVTVHAKVFLQETSVGSNDFQCLVQYKYSGVASGSGAQTFPISGNTHIQKQLPHGITIDVDVTNWDLTSTSIAFNLSVSLSGHGMGPDYLFHNTLFGGPLPKQTMPAIDKKIEAFLAANAA